MYVPEEIVHAGGALPMVIAGGGEPTSLADSHMPGFACSLVRSNLELALRGTLDFCDGFVFPYTCDSMQCLSEIWKRNLPNTFIHHIVLPTRLDTPAARPYLLDELRRFKSKLEGLLGHEISQRALWDSIAVYNTNRMHMQRLYQLRRSKPGLLKARQMLAVVSAAMVMPKEEHNQWVAELLEVAGERESNGQGKIHLVLSGILATNPDLLDLIEELGGVIVDDDLFNGARYFSGLANQTPDPIESLAHRFLEMMPCPTKHNPARGWAEHIVNLARQGQADGVIILLLKFCDPHAFDYPYLKDRLDEAGIPRLLIETGQESQALGQIRTRLQAFFEVIGGVRAGWG
jgi:bcr-type benzoyl-CoA reductase subunit C